jgi:multiple sugar transport system permease protein
MIYTIYRWWRYRPGKVAFKEETAGLLMISPWVIGFTVFTLFSMGLSLIMTLTKWSGMTTINQAEWVGLQNFSYIFAQDSNIVSSFFVTLYYALLAIPVGQVSSLAVALLMNNDVKGISFFRAAWYLPTVLSGIAMAILWSWIFAPDGGLMNLILEPILGIFGLSPPEWFGKDAHIFAVPGFVIMGLMGVGGGMLIYLAGLKAIPDSLYEAAKIDGAGNWQQFVNVTLPMLSPIILFNVVVSLIGSFQVFTQAYIMTPGGGREGSTLFYVLYLFQQAFDAHEFGYASAMAWILFVIILTLTLISIKLGEKKVHYEGMKL